MDKRLVTFIALAMIIYVTCRYLDVLFQAQNAPNPAAAKNDAAGKDGKKDADGKKGDQKKPAEIKAADNKPGEKNPAEKNPGEKNPAKNGANAGQPAGQAPPNAAAVPPPAEDAKKVAPQWFTLGSVASPVGEKKPYEMLVTLTTRGAAIERIELSDPRYRELDDSATQPGAGSGYLGHLASTPAAAGGCQVQVVGAGTPAAAAGLQAGDEKTNTPGDIITAIDGRAVANPQDLVDRLTQTEPGQKIELTVRRGDKPINLSATLSRQPLSVIRPEFKTDPLEVFEPDKHDPLSYLLTLHQIDDEAGDSASLDDEMGGLHLRTNNWEGRRIDADTVEFARKLPKWDLELVKRYQLAPRGDSSPGYHLLLTVEVRNNSETKTHKVAYQLDGATGLPTEGWWYAYRPSPEWLAGISLRDVAWRFEGLGSDVVNCRTLADTRFKQQEAIKAGQQREKGNGSDIKVPDPGHPMIYAGVDAQYFSAVLIPQREKPAKDKADGNKPNQGNLTTPSLAEARAMIVGEIPDKEKLAYRTKVDVSCRLTTKMATLAPAAALVNQYEVFVGPKQPSLLEQYGDVDTGQTLSGLLYYGSFGWVAKPMVAVLELFHLLVRNYGLSILMLTVLVRGCMFPLSRKQAKSAQKMQELQPEMKKINEKYKGNAEQRTKATQELWRKHNYSPLGGCWMMFVQLPVFMGLYRSLAVNVELRQAPLFGGAMRWCSNLAAPDMLMNWSSFMPTFLSAPTAWLGPYMNILPLATVGLFLWQQTLFMPPATDESSAMQQKIMKYMTGFMGLMFFKVPSGLCLYFIASSLWGICERKLLPRTIPAAGSSSHPPAARESFTRASSNGSSGSSRKKQRGKR